jgi:peptidoglycan/xylan/chitin deacetylase (PgdA/CDA1 family)
MGIIACSVQEASQQEKPEQQIEQGNQSQKTPSDSTNSQSPKQQDEHKKNSDQADENIEANDKKGDNNVELVEYNGPVEHIFFHPLIVYPKLAFDQDTLAKGYNDYFVTVNEFKRALNELYKNNYILIDIHLLFENKEDNTIVMRKLKLPKGKKPLILSIDDMNYYDYMRENGNAYKLLLDDNGNVASYSKTPDGKEVISHDNEIVPILDQFVKEHPDFSFNGAKGLIALTGYQGVLGYRTNELNSPEFENEKKEALKVINRLKETGWTFASHGYGHLDANKVGYEQLVKDTERWKREVEPLVGATDIYVYPYGSRVETGSRKFKYLVESGFKVLCSVGPQPYLKEYNSSAIMMDRRHIDGISLQTQKAQLSPLLDADKVLESEVRPKNK